MKLELQDKDDSKILGKHNLLPDISICFNIHITLLLEINGHINGRLASPSTKIY